MPTTAEYLNDLIKQKNALADNLNEKGIEADRSETFNTLVPKVLEIEGGDTETDYNNGFEDGKQAEYDAFWDGYQNKGNRYHYNLMFAGQGWNNETYNPKYDFGLAPNGDYILRYAYNMYASSQLVDTKREFYLHNDATLIGAMFEGAQQMQTIRTIHTNENVNYSTWFGNCKALENITFEGVIGNNIDFASCVKLSKDSIENIIGCLSDTVSGKTVTFSATAVNNAFGSSESDEWLSLIAPKKDWNISLI